MSPRRPRTINRRWEVRVLVALPVVWVLFATVEGYVTIQLVRAALNGLTRGEARALDEIALAVIAIASLVAIGGGVALALAVTRPVRDLLLKIQHRLKGEATLQRTAANEIQQLSNAFDNMLLSFDKFVNDAQIVDGMPLGVLAVDGRDTIIRANAEARRLLPGRALEGSRVADLAAGRAADLTELLQGIRRSGVPAEIPSTVFFPDGSGEDVPREVVTLYPTTVVGEVVITIRDLAYIQAVRGHIQRVDQFAALGAHVASLAHELRGALMGIQTLVDALQPCAADIKLHDKLQEEIERSVRLLTEIRGFGQAGARERRLCDLGRLVEDTSVMVEAQFAAKGVAVHRQIATGLPPLLLDHDRATQAVINVVTNAFEATPPGGAVTIAVEHAGEATLVSVANTGSFIPPEEQQKIFTLFYTTKPRGSGYGLAMARRTMMDHGGEITIASSPEAGTQFVLRFPDQTASPASAAALHESISTEEQVD